MSNITKTADLLISPEKLGLPVGDYDFWDIYQTPDGAMWFATNKGLIKYENGNVTKFTVENGLPSNDVKKIFRTKNGEFMVRHGRRFSAV